MFDIFKKPHPFIFSIYSVIIPSILTFLIIVVLAPFRFQTFELGDRLLSALIIALLVALGIYLSVKLVEKSFPKAISEDQWTVGKEFLLVLLVVGIIVLLISFAFFLLQSEEVSFLVILLETASITLAISVLPVLISILYEQYRHQKEQLEKAALLTASLKAKNEALAKNQENEPSILIKADNNEIALQLKPKDLIYLKSDGNYVEVYFRATPQTQKKVIRNSLKAIENILPAEQFFRCHNSYIVNGNHIFRVEGNARNLSLHMIGVSEQIPVSRAKAKIIDTFLENLQNS